ncbi:MAG: branched-chain amino acid ABC transporter substrate-binding protein [Betaproteobacteria bacterium]|nr:branched-chain amino acid ABC transporter substrate-binding protein [Betaproteobacteria bacterium]
MTETFATRFAVLAVVAALLAACGGQEQPPEVKAPAAAQERVVKLGFAAPLTGPQAHYGEEMKNGVVLALEQINAAKPVIDGKPTRFELVAEDDQADPKQGTLVAQKLVDAGIAGMLGHFNSGTSIPASKIYADAGIPQIAMATAPAYTAQGYRTTFRAMTSDTQQGSVIGRFAVEKLGAKRIAIIDDRTAYGQGLADEFEKAARTAGGTIVKREFTNDKATDFTAILTSIKAVRPDAIFFGGADAQAGPMARQLRQLGIKAQLIGGEMVRSATFLRLAGDAAEGTIASLAGLPLERMPGGKEYEAGYRAKFGAPVETYSPYAYDATRALIAAMKRADSVDPAKYLPELAGTQMAGVTSSNIAYDEKGDLRDVTITVYRVEHGEWGVLETAGAK